MTEDIEARAAALAERYRRLRHLVDEATAAGDYEDPLCGVPPHAIRDLRRELEFEGQPNAMRMGIFMSENVLICLSDVADVLRAGTDDPDDPDDTRRQRHHEHEYVDTGPGGLYCLPGNGWRTRRSQVPAKDSRGRGNADPIALLLVAG
jgi:hypothetical protein